MSLFLGEFEEKNRVKMSQKTVSDFWWFPTHFFGRNSKKHQCLRRTPPAGGCTTLRSYELSVIPAPLESADNT
jgi:hypothetical protein